MATETESLIDWRIYVFEEELGFKREDAEMLAQSKDDEGWLISCHKVAELIAKGCPHTLILQIVL